jgi:hypothetical protein
LADLEEVNPPSAIVPEGRFASNMSPAAKTASEGNNTKIWLAIESKRE